MDGWGRFAGGRTCGPRTSHTVSCMTTIPWPGIWALLHAGLGVLLFIFTLTTPSTDHDLEPPG